MIVAFANEGTEDIHFGRSTKAARKICPQELYKLARRKLAVIDYAPTLDSLRVPPGNRLEELRGDRVGTHSIRINDQYRICFRWNDGQVTEVEIADYH